jgi:hypothetical protein
MNNIRIKDKKSLDPSLKIEIKQFKIVKLLLECKFFS